jgi:hypothetical protein
MAIEITNYTTNSGVALASAYGVVTNVQINKIMNDRTYFNPETESEETVTAHYAVTYSAEIWKDLDARGNGLNSVETIGSAPGDLRFVSTNLTDVFTECYDNLATVVDTNNTEV